MTRSTSDRGAILIHVALGLIALTVFTGFIVDYGTFWVSRNQAQNAADAGALAGITARVYDDGTNPPVSTTTGVVPDAVYGATQANYVWGQTPPTGAIQIGYTCPDASTNCVVVDVYRDGTNSSTALPTFFLNLLNISSQGTKAEAIAEASTANGTGCMRPWFLEDQGWVLPNDLGANVTLSANLAPSGYGQLDVGSGASAINSAITGCVNGTYYVGETVPTKPGAKDGPEKSGVDQLITWDPSATVTISGSGSSTTASVTNSCANTSSGCSCPGNTGNMCPNGPFVSPRVAIVPLCNGSTDPNCDVGGPNNGNITITGFMAFFINSFTNNGNSRVINATLISSAGIYVSSGGSPTGSGTFLKTISLIR